MKKEGKNISTFIPQSVVDEYKRSGKSWERFITEAVEAKGSLTQEMADRTMIKARDMQERVDLQDAFKMFIKEKCTEYEQFVEHGIEGYQERQTRLRHLLAPMMREMRFSGDAPKVVAQRFKVIAETVTTGKPSKEYEEAMKKWRC